jgi:hypothetical protein
MMEAFLVPEKTAVSAKGDGPTIELKATEGRVFLLTLAITDIIEQESLDVSIFASADGAAWDPKPVVAFKQRFYRAETPILLDLAARPDVKFIRAHWEVNRWGRGTETPMFEFNVALREVPAEILQEAAGRVRAS